MNRLATETSPYLRQHRDNPVDWYPWGDEAFAAARERDVPILLSVGYSACHWCHVMAHESFEDAEVANLMNVAFVNVKVDREERPDVDAIYMDAVQAMTGRGGWPMTVFLSPTGEPFYGGTYFPRDTFVKLLAAVSSAWRTKRDDLLKNTGKLRETISRSARAKAGDKDPPEQLIPATVAGLAKAFDQTWGGFGQAPKFPSTMSLDLVLTELLYRAPTDAAVAPLTTVLTTSLDAMASGGMYDHIGGGFARYSVDEKWLVPHFEKMLYDQALLVRLYARAASALADRFDTSRWKQVVTETVGYVLREMTQPDGGFSSAQDADSPGPDGHGHEGLFHTWTPDEVRAVLGDGPDTDAVLDWYGITDEGNFAEPGKPSRSIPTRLEQRGQFLRPPHIEAARARLYEARWHRPHPGLDDKVLTEWNGLMIAALAEAGALFGEQSWIDAAAKAGRFLLDNLRDGDRRWFRVWHADGQPRARHQALAADHATLLDAFTRLGEATGEANWIYEAMDMADTLLDHFWDPGEGGLYTTPDDGERLIARQKDLFDNATPSANSTAAVALVRLAALTDEQRYANHADRILQLIGPMVPRGASAFCNALAALALRTRGIKEVAVVGDRPDLVAVVRERWRPNVVLAWGERYDSPLWENRTDGLAYVCEHFTCQAPQDSPDGLRAQLT
ncbi:thioredoxin domain-containing protein [Desertimonas flava]|uniref:thioredoxin domain-containing protein n=1 Tax=Desertimonas flava TaxID=2064846 RepID=UPI000E34E818|nr:thioredoxin domain-containing protein [Desertimonas flava]